MYTWKVLKQGGAQWHKLLISALKGSLVRKASKSYTVRLWLKKQKRTGVGGEDNKQKRNW